MQHDFDGEHLTHADETSVPIVRTTSPAPCSPARPAHAHGSPRNSPARMSPLLTRRGTWAAESPKRSLTPPPPSAPQHSLAHAVPPTSFAHEAPAALSARPQASDGPTTPNGATLSLPQPTTEPTVQNGFIIARFDGPASFADVVDSSSRAARGEAFASAFSGTHTTSPARDRSLPRADGRAGEREHTTDEERLERGSFAHVQQHLGGPPEERLGRHAFRAARSISPYTRQSTHPYERPPSPGRHYSHGAAHQPRSAFRSDSAHSQEGRRERRPSNARAHPYRPSSPLIAQRGRSNSKHSREDPDRRSDALPSLTHDASGAFIALPEHSLHGRSQSTSQDGDHQLSHAAQYLHLDYRRRTSNDRSEWPADSRHKEQQEEDPSPFAAFTVWCNCSQRPSLHPCHDGPLPPLE